MINVLLSPYAYAKMLWFCRKEKTEITGFGISPELDDLLYVADFMTVPQECTSSSCDIDDKGLAEYFTACVKRKLEPVQFMRMWFHTHPGTMLTPSGTDTATMRKCFGDAAWQIMLIMTNDGKMSATLEARPSLLKDVVLTSQAAASVYWGGCFSGVNDKALAAWQAEYAANIKSKTFPVVQSNQTVYDTAINNKLRYDPDRCSCGMWLNSSHLCPKCDIDKIAADRAFNKALKGGKLPGEGVARKIFLPKGGELWTNTNTLNKKAPRAAAPRQLLQPSPV